MSEEFKERRKFIRIYRHFILKYSLASSPQVEEETSQINNISQGGMSFAASRRLKAGEEVNVELKTPFLNEAMSLQGIILECREKIPKLIYEIRLQFKDLSVVAKDVLAKIEMYASKEKG